MLGSLGARRRAAVVGVVAAAALVAPQVPGGAVAASGTGSISGVVTDRDGRPVVGVPVRVTGAEHHQVLTDDLGRYQVTGLGGVSYYVCVEPPRDGELELECWDDSLGAGQAQRVRVDGGAVTGIDAELEPVSHLRGRVIDESGLPVPGVQVGTSWSPPEGGVVYWGGPTVLTGADGTWDLRHASPGLHSVSFSDPGNRYLSRSFATAGEEVTPVEVTRGASVGGLDVVVEPLAHLRGRVLTTAGAVVRGTRVELHRRYGPTAAVTLERSVPVGADGRYDLAGVRPGAYRLRFVPPAGSPWTGGSWPASPTLQDAQDVVVERNDDVDWLDWRLRPARALQNTARPRIHGVVRTWRILTADCGRWDVRNRDLDCRVRWFVDGRRIRDVSVYGLVVRPRYEGRRLTVRADVRPTLANRAPASAWSAPRRVGPERW